MPRHTVHPSADCKEPRALEDDRGPAPGGPRPRRLALVPSFNPYTLFRCKSAMRNLFLARHRPPETNGLGVRARVRGLELVLGVGLGLG